jgi:hypothetical protein
VLNFGHKLKNQKFKQKLKIKMVQQRRHTRFLSGLAALALLAGLVAQVFLMPGDAHAATQITSRSLTLQDGATDGGSDPGGTVNHFFSFSLHNTAAALGSIVFQYCTTAAPVPGGIGCLAPTGITTNGGSIAAQTGATGFTTYASSSLDDPSDGVKNVFTIERSSASTLASNPTAVTYQINGIVNPSATNTTFFVRISTYTSLNGTGTSLEAGTVAASTANPIVITGTMPESLVFCTGATVSTTGGVPDCTTATSGNISFNQLFSPVSTAYTTSQMAASTNAGSGYAITVGGATLTSGSNTINAMTTAATSTFGVSQFGLNLVLNDGTAYTNAPNIPLSSNIAPASNGTNYNAAATSGFNTNGTFEFNNTALNTVANSASKGTDAQIYTVSYIVNVPGSLPAGTYTSTLTYICTPTF